VIQLQPLEEKPRDKRLRAIVGEHLADKLLRQTISPHIRQ
jgi:hypothetical protein